MVNKLNNGIWEYDLNVHIYYGVHVYNIVGSVLH